MKGRQGIMPGYNAQAMASPVAQSSGGGMLITAADVVDSAADSGQLVPMLEQAEEMIGESVPVTLADGGYHTAANLAAGEQRGDLFVMPERYHPGVQGPYFKDKFLYDSATDSYICPKGQRLPFGGSSGTTVRSRDRSESTVPQGPYVALVRPMGFAPKTCVPEGRCGSGHMMLYFESTGSG